MSERATTNDAHGCSSNNQTQQYSVSLLIKMPNSFMHTFKRTASTAGSPRTPLTCMPKNLCTELAMDELLSAYVPLASAASRLVSYSILLRPSLVVGLPSSRNITSAVGLPSRSNLWQNQWPSLSGKKLNIISPAIPPRLPLRAWCAFPTSDRSAHAARAWRQLPGNDHVLYTVIEPGDATT